MPRVSTSSTFGSGFKRTKTMAKRSRLKVITTVPTFVSFLPHFVLFYELRL